MEAIETKFKSLFTIYKKWISENPDTCSDVEVFMKYFTYFVAGMKNEFISLFNV